MRTPAGFAKHIKTFVTEAAVSATAELFVFAAKEPIVPLAVRITPMAVTGTNPTCVMSMLNGSTKISTDNAITALEAKKTLEATFAVSQSIAEGDVLTIKATLGGTDPVFTKSVVEFEYLA